MDQEAGFQHLLWSQTHTIQAAQGEVDRIDKGIDLFWDIVGQAGITHFVGLFDQAVMRVITLFVGQETNAGLLNAQQFTIELLHSGDEIWKVVHDQ